MRRFNTIIESANPPGINQLWIDKGKLRYFSAGSWRLIAGGGGSGGGSTIEIGINGNWFIDGVDTGKPSRGEAGPKGEDGKNGINGTNGTNGVTPHIGDNKHWFIDNIDTGILAEGINGKDGTDGNDGLNGKDGIDGTDGISAGFGEPVATAESVSNNAPAEVTIEATGPDTAKVFTFHFKIPKGKDGSGGSGGTGVDGKTPILQIGNVTTVTAEGNATANVRYISDDPDGNPIYAVDFGIPRGSKGDQGEAGQDGTDGTNGTNGQDGVNGKTPQLSIGTVTTINAGENAVVTLTSDGEDAQGNPKFKINYSIPRGANGTNGTNGADGKDGVDGTNGQDGATPEIGANGNWFINGTDTTKPSRGERGEPGTTTYSALTDKPSINGVELNGNKTAAQLGIQAAGAYATETYVTESIETSIGNINAILDSINGEVI